MPNIKIIGGCSIFAFVISLFSGIIGGVGFLTILFRALLGALLFGLLSGGIVMLLERMVPELFVSAGTEDGENEETAQKETGANVDITLDEETESYSPSADSSEGRGAAAASGDTASGEAASEKGTSEEAASKRAASGAAASQETNAEEEPQQSDSRDEEDEFVEEVAENGGGETGEPASFLPPDGGENESGGGDGFEEVDTLPDLEDFADSFEGVAASQEEGNEERAASNSSAGSSGGLSSLGGGASSSSVDVNGDQQDPATVAKAVRTLMKKDQEG